MTHDDIKFSHDENILEYEIYNYVKINFGINTNTEKIIKFNMMTFMPIITDKQNIRTIMFGAI